MSRWSVEFSPKARRDLQRLYQFLLVHDRSVARAALEELSQAIEMLEHFPRSCRKARGTHHLELRELIVPFGQAGYIVLFRMHPPARVQIIGVRHQREDDY